MIRIKIVDYEQLPEEVDKKFGISDNGCGKEFANYLLIYNDESVLIHCFSDAMEPEDTRFTRDLSWIKDIILEAYNMGIQDSAYD